GRQPIVASWTRRSSSPAARMPAGPLRSAPSSAPASPGTRPTYACSPSWPSGSGTGRPRSCRCRSSRCTVGVHGFAGRCTTSPTIRTTRSAEDIRPPYGCPRSVRAVGARVPRSTSTAGSGGAGGIIYPGPVPDWMPGNLAEVAVFTPLRIVFLIVVAVVVRYVAHRLIDRSVRRSVAQPPRPRSRAVEAIAVATRLPAERRAQRIQALGSLGKSVITGVLLVVTVIMVLSELGFNVTTVVAGTSLIGVALAFGFQSIVKDFMSGVFLL